MPLEFLLTDADETERQARLRELRCLAALILGWGHPVVAQIEQAVADPMVVEPTLLALAALPGKRRRQLLAAYGALHGMVNRQHAQKVLDSTVCPKCGW